MRRNLTGVFLGLFLGASASAGEVPITIDWAGVRLEEPYPVTMGFPFARGKLTDAAACRLLLGTREIPLQKRVLAWWPDGSVKWLLLDFQVPPGTEHLTLQFGPRVRARALPSGTVRIIRSALGITVDTGPLQFTLRRDGSGFIDEWRFAGRRVVGKGRLNLLDFLHTIAPADYHPMDRYLRGARSDPSRVVVDDVAVEEAGPLRAVVRVDGRYTYRLVGSTIAGADLKGDCPFRIRIHAYAGRSFLRVEHFFYYEGDGDHDFARRLALSLALPEGMERIRLVGGAEGGGAPLVLTGGAGGLYQADPDEFTVWERVGRAARPRTGGGRFAGFIEVVGRGLAVALAVRNAWQNAPKALHADLGRRVLSAELYPPEAPPLDFRRHAREWSVGETGSPDAPAGRKPVPFRRGRYRLASKGVGKTHYLLFWFHRAGIPLEQLRGVGRLFEHRPLAFAPPAYYARTLALGRYRQRIPGQHEEVERALASSIDLWRFSQERFRWYGFWLYGNLCQHYNRFLFNGRWSREFGRWGWANGDSMGRLGYALMLQTLRYCRRDWFEFGEAYLLNLHDVCATHTPAYPHHYGSFQYLRGASHRHGAWPWACPYVGARGSHPVGIKIYYFLTGEGRAGDILDEIVQLALRNPNGGEGDGPLGTNAQAFLYMWETTGRDRWRRRLKGELERSQLLRTARGGWQCMLVAAFGIKDALEEYIDLTGDTSLQHLLLEYADRCMPERMKRHWTWGGYFRVYASAYNLTRDPKYRRAIEEVLAVLVGKVRSSANFSIPRRGWPGPPGGPAPFLDGNVIRDVPFALYSLHLGEEGR